MNRATVLRSLIRACLVVAIGSCSTGCSPAVSCERCSPYDGGADAGMDAGAPSGPVLQVDPDALGFGTELGWGTFVGTAPSESLVLQNTGPVDLVIASVTGSGATEFTVTGPTKSTLKQNEVAYLQVVFRPLAVARYSGAISIVSNAENAPLKSITLRGCGIDTDGGRPDGGC